MKSQTLDYIASMTFANIHLEPLSV